MNQGNKILYKEKKEEKKFSRFKIVIIPREQGCGRNVKHLKSDIKKISRSMTTFTK